MKSLNVKKILQERIEEAPYLWREYILKYKSGIGEDCFTKEESYVCEKYIEKTGINTDKMVFSSKTLKDIIKRESQLGNTHIVKNIILVMMMTEPGVVDTDECKMMIEESKRNRDIYGIADNIYSYDEDVCRPKLIGLVDLESLDLNGLINYYGEPHNSFSLEKLNETQVRQIIDSELKMFPLNVSKLAYKLQAEGKYSTESQGNLKIHNANLKAAEKRLKKAEEFLGLKYDKKFLSEIMQQSG